jgi:hypothetical protein
VKAHTPPVSLGSEPDTTPVPAPARKPRGRLLGLLAFLFIGLAVLVIGYEAMLWAESGSYRMLTLGELWYRLDASGLNLAQAIVQRYVSPAAWDYAVVPMLLRVAWPTFMLSGLVVLTLAYLRRRRG